MRIGHIFRILRFYIHWSKEATCLEIIEKDHPAVCKKQIRSLGLLKNQEWLLIADVSKEQWTQVVKKRVAAFNGKIVNVPKNMTNHFQTLDLTVSQVGKSIWIRVYKNIHERSANTTRKWKTARERQCRY